LSGQNVGGSLGIADVFAAVNDAGVVRSFDEDSVSGFIARLQFDF